MGLRRWGSAGPVCQREFRLHAARFPNIFAAGDVAGPYQFTHTASHQAWYASVNALFGQFRKFKADYRFIPWTTFIDPEVARVGLNETEAKRDNIAYEATILPIRRLDRAIAEGATTGFIKVLTAQGSDRILGAVIVSENAGELVAEYVLAMKHRIGLNKILATVHAYPTLSESSKLGRRVAASTRAAEVVDDCRCIIAGGGAIERRHPENVKQSRSGITSC